MVTEAQINQIIKQIKQNAVLSEEVIQGLRDTFNDIHFTYCMDDDVAIAKPLYCDPAFNLYMIDSREHCLTFTQDMSIATGIVVAEVEDEYEELDLTPKADCSECPHRADRLATGRCKPGDTCVRVMSGRQITRFFKSNPDLAENYAGDDFWERRAIAARYISQQKLQQMIHDPDEVVRRVLAYRLSLDVLPILMDDEDREVRITVADRLPSRLLEKMINDPDYLVRHTIAKRLNPGRLFRMINDPDREVRKMVALRIPIVSLGLMIDDGSEEIRRVIADRIAPNELKPLLEDEDWLVRFSACQRAPIGWLHPMVEDDDQDVRECAQKRLDEARKKQMMKEKS